MALVVSLKNNIDIDIIHFKRINSLCRPGALKMSAMFTKGKKFTQINPAMEGQMKTVWSSVSIYFLFNPLYK